MIDKVAFLLAHEIALPGFLATHSRIMKRQYITKRERVDEQNGRLRAAVGFAYSNVPYYHRLFNRLGLKPDDIKTGDDLRRLPILNKDDIRANWQALRPIGLNKLKFVERATGGTTGTPLTYRLSTRDRMIGGAILYRGWSYAGYRLGDRMVYLAGSSLGVHKKGRWHPSAKEVGRNARMLSSFDMSQTDLAQYVAAINAFRPRFIRGYPSSLEFLSKWISESRKDVHRPLGVFVTSESLFPHMRKNIETAFGCDVFNHYGLNDGGISAFECAEHTGLHVDTERSLMEVVDEHGNCVEEGEGRVLATSLINEAMPFLRYDTGDVAVMMRGDCNCGRKTALIHDIVGRTTDILYTPDGKAIHGWFFLYLFWELGEGIKQYQVVQMNPAQIMISIVPDENFSETALDDIRTRTLNKCAEWNIEFKIVDKIPQLSDGKTKFIVSRINRDPI